MVKNNYPIHLRLDPVNRKRLDNLKDYFDSDPFLTNNVRNDNQMFNFIISEFIFLFIATNHTTDRSYRAREEQILAPKVEEDGPAKLMRKLQQLDKNEMAITYLLLAMYNRSAGTVKEGGSVFAPGTLNNQVMLELRKILEQDYRSNKLRQNKF